MKRVRVERLGASLLPLIPIPCASSTSSTAAAKAAAVPATSTAWTCRNATRRPVSLASYSTSSSSTTSTSFLSRPRHRPSRVDHVRSFATSRRTCIQEQAQSPSPSPDTIGQVQAVAEELHEEQEPALRLPSSPHPAAAAKSAKLAALHARLSLSPRLPLQTLARCLVDASADSRPEFNNASLATLGHDLLAYYTAEWLICNYPRIPIDVLFAAQYAYFGPKTLSNVRGEWGVDAAAAPGYEVDPGFLQFTRVTPGNSMAADGVTRVKDAFMGIVGTAEKAARRGEDVIYRRGLSSRILHDEFGDVQSGLRPELPAGVTPADVEAEVSGDNTSSSSSAVTLEAASANFVRAVFGAIYLHCGTAATHAFHASHILSRHLPLHTLFTFKFPTRDLSRLCAREGFEPPVARLISETGRHSRSPVFIVGVYSGQDKLGEGAGSSLDEARVRAAADALRSWYLYSPPKDDVVLPSATEPSGSASGAASKKAWKPQMVDIGEIIT